MKPQVLPEKSVLVYCDGACSGNPGPGGWGAIVATPDGEVHELGGASPSTTNNQMEIKATTEAIRLALHREEDVFIYTDSVYVIRGITQWIWGWQRNGWKTGEGKEVANREFWQELSRLVAQVKAQGREIHWSFVRGHNGNPGNERCDEIAVAFSKGRRPQLFHGPLLGYQVAVYDLPANEPLPEMTRDRGPKASAYSYLSLIGTEAERHLTWADCERRVKGRSGAKFKKAMSADEEDEILRTWGIEPHKLK